MKPNRAVRVDLRGISNRTAKELLATYGSVIDHEARQRVGRLLASGFGSDLADLRQVASIAVLEAALTYAGRTCSPRTWTVKVVRWRLNEHVQAAFPAGEERLALPELVANDGDQEAQVLRGEQLAWLEGALGRLPPRLGMVLTARLTGETQGEIGMTLGVTTERVRQNELAAREKLQQWAVREGLDAD